MQLNGCGSCLEEIKMEVYIVISELFEGKVVERVYANEKDAIDFCNMMNQECFGFYYYSKQKVL